MRRPTSITVICVLAILQVYRIIAYPYAQGAWFFPASADVFFGITAPLVAFALWRRIGLGIWTIGIVWLALSFFDYVDGLATAITFGPPTAEMGSGPAIVWFLGWLAVNVIALALLARNGVRSYFLRAL